MAASVIGYVWNAGANRFIGPGGRFVSIADVRAALNSAIRASAVDAAAIAEQYNAGVIGVAEFENQMGALIKSTHIYSGAVASGGFNALGTSELATIEAQLAQQFAYLSDWADDLASGVARTASASRAAMYAKAATSTYDQILRAGQLDAGMSEERNILNPGEHCAMCQDMTSVGWVTIGTLIPIGYRTCLTNCNCETEYR